jgi:DNA repair protein RadC
VLSGATGGTGVVECGRIEGFPELRRPESVRRGLFLRSFHFLGLKANAASPFSFPEAFTMYVAELKRRRYRGQRPPEVNSPQQAYAVLKPRIDDWSREHFLAVLLNARNGVVGVETVSVGSLSASIVHPREVFKPAIVASAAGIVLGHNHPSGDPEPSPEDLSVTKRLSEVATLMGIELHDHIIFTDRTFVSLKERGVL